MLSLPIQLNRNQAAHEYIMAPLLAKGKDTVEGKVGSRLGCLCSAESHKYGNSRAGMCILLGRSGLARFSVLSLFLPTPACDVGRIQMEQLE